MSYKDALLTLIQINTVGIPIKKYSSVGKDPSFSNLTLQEVQETLIYVIKHSPLINHQYSSKSTMIQNSS